MGIDARGGWKTPYYALAQAHSCSSTAPCWLQMHVPWLSPLLSNWPNLPRRDLHAAVMTAAQKTDCSCVIMTVSGPWQIRFPREQQRLQSLICLCCAQHLTSSLLTSWKHQRSHLTQFTSVSSLRSCSLGDPTLLSTAKCTLEKKENRNPIKCCGEREKKNNFCSNAAYKHR